MDDRGSSANGPNATGGGELCPAGNPADATAIAHLKEALARGIQWQTALLESIGMWCSPAELYRGRRYKYLIGDEAFDWLLLAERLLGEVRGTVPEDEISELLFSGRLPTKLTKEDFRNLLGNAKYKAHLNFVYGVVVEEALLMAVEEEVHKERSIMGYEGGDVTEEAFSRVYGAARKELLTRFQEQKGMTPSHSVNLADMREFTYWLFKYRLETCDPERVASDTRKALQQVRKAGAQNLYL